MHILRETAGSSSSSRRRRRTFLASASIRKTPTLERLQHQKDSNIRKTSLHPPSITSLTKTSVHSSSDHMIIIIIIIATSIFIMTTILAMITIIMITLSLSPGSPKWWSSKDEFCWERHWWSRGCGHWQRRSTGDHHHHHHLTLSRHDICRTFYITTNC